MSEIKLREVSEIPEICEKRFIVRVDLNVPIKDDVVQNEFRIKRSIPTIEHLLRQGGRVIILTHVGRDPENSTLPLLATLQKYIPVTYVNGLIGTNVRQAIEEMGDGTAILLENLRSHREEEINDQNFAKELASYADYYINDAFSVSHRAHASVVGIPEYIPGYAGMTFMEEFESLSKALEPEYPSLFILGGAKFETKAPLIEQYSNHYTNAFIGGALANDFLKGRGYEVGQSLLSPVDLSTSPLVKKENILLPVDVVAKSVDYSHEVGSDSVLPEEKIVDAGSLTVQMLAPYIKEAKTILWNGPLGYYEEGFDAGTKGVAKLVAESDAFSVIGGGDTVAAIESLGLTDSFSFLSTAGGAMLEFLEKRTLPGIDALTK